MENEKFITETHSLWVSENTSLVPISRQVEELLQGFLCYPDFEWPKFGIVPPENHDLIGSWRSSNGDIFVFLLEVYSKKSASSSDYLLMLVGLSLKVKSLDDVIYSHKGNLIKIEKRELKRKEVDEGLSNESDKNTIGQFSKMVGVFTIIINAFSLYLRSLSLPDNMHPKIYSSYQIVLTAIHFSSLILLLLVVLIFILYTLRYGYLVLRRMK